MTMPPLPAAGDTDWRDDWAQAVHNAAAAVTTGRLTDEALTAASVAAGRTEFAALEGARRAAYRDLFAAGSSAGWYITRVSAAKYQLLRRLGGGYFAEVDFEQVPALPGGGNLVHQIHQSRIRMAVTSADETTATARTGTWTTGVTNAPATYGGTYAMTLEALAAVTYTTPAGVTAVGVRALKLTNGGFAKVEVDGDATRANYLPTAQDLIDTGIATSAILAANGGFFAPTDRVFDCYASASESDVPLVFADGLTPAAHTLKLTNSGHKRAASTGARLYDSGVVYALGSETLNGAGVVLAKAAELLPGHSAHEYAYQIIPAGGTTAAFVGQNHGYEIQDSLTLTVDGDEVVMTDGQRLPVKGYATFRRRTRLHHPDTGTTDVAAVTTAYRLDAEGLTITHEDRWLVNATGTSCYVAMFPLNGELLDRAAFPVSDTASTLTTFTGPSVVIGGHRTGQAVLWDSTGQFAAMLDVLNPEVASNNWAKVGSLGMWIEDRPRAATLKLAKTYFNRIAANQNTAIAAGEVWTCAAVYRWARFPAGANNALPARPH